jgi:hypothetical protein
MREGDEWMVIRGYDNTPGQVVWGMMVQSKKYTEY